MMVGASKGGGGQGGGGEGVLALAATDDIY